VSSAIRSAIRWTPLCLCLLAPACTVTTRTKVASCMYLARRITYVADKVGHDYWQTPDETVRIDAGDCEDQAIYLHWLLQDEGIASEVIFGRGDTSRPLAGGHAWVECDIDGQQYLLDVSSNLMIQRDQVPPGKYVPMLKDADVAEKVWEFTARSGIEHVNSHYARPIEATGPSAPPPAGP